MILKQSHGGVIEMTKRRNLYFFATVMVTGVLFFVLGMGAQPNRGGAQDSAPVETIVIRDETGFSQSISTVANILMPAVVHIDVTGTVLQRSHGFWNDLGPQQREVPVQALGSGVIISKDGYIITNNHVVQNADKIEVELYDGTHHTAELVGTDPGTDLAVVKIEPVPGIRYAKLGDSDEINVGEWVIAIGSPRGLDWTVTAGIVSAKNRRNIGALGPAGYEDFIQTDASINPGNSGGPLINLSGEVIGINSLIVSASRGSNGLGFAIPSNMVQTISDSLIESGKVKRGYLGVNIQDITPEIARNLKLDENFMGVIVADLSPGGPAEKAGLERGDIVTFYDDQQIESGAQLRNMVAVTIPGSLVKLKVIRDNEGEDVTVRIGDLEKAQNLSRAEGNDDPLGLTVERVSTDIARNIGLRKATGVIVTNVMRGSVAEEMGLTQGDIIFRVNNREVKESKLFNEIVRESEKEGSVMLLLRDARSGRIGYLVVPLNVG
jgi:serine protease Do